MKHTSIIILCFSIFFNGNVFAVKTSKVDSLVKIVNTTSIDTVKSDAFIELAKLYYFKNKYYKSVQYVNRAIAVIPDNKVKLAMANNFLGLIYYHIGDYPTALSFHFKSLKYREEIGDDKLLAVAYNSIAVVYTSLSNIEKSNYYLNKALIIEEKYNNTGNIAMIFNNISNNFSSQNKYNEAIEYLLKSESIIDDTNLDKALLLINIGSAYYELNKYNKAKEYFFTAIDYCKKTDNDYYLALAYQHIGILFNAIEDYKQALFFFNNSIFIAERINAYSILKQCYVGLTYIYGIKSNPDSLIKYNNLYYSVNDSIFNSKTADKVAELQIKYDFDKKEKQIENLKIKNQLADKKQKIMIAVFLVSFLFLFIIFLFVYNRKRKALSDKFAVKQNIKLIKYEDVIDNSNGADKIIEAPKDTNSTLSDEFKTMLEVSISKKIRKEKLYLKSDFSLNELAKLLETNRRYVSQVINEKFGQNFSSFINEFRIKEAMRLMSNHDYDKYTIESISRKVGFNSISAFNGSFKRVAGVTPSTFVKSVKAEK